MLTHLVLLVSVVKLADEGGAKSGRCLIDRIRHRARNAVGGGSDNSHVGAREEAQLSE